MQTVCKTYFPPKYKSKLDVRQTVAAIKFLKDYFERQLADELNLTRVSAPLFVRPETGLNDNLSGVERPVSFDVKAIGGTAEIVHSLAKWKRFALKRYGFYLGEGLYTDMNAIRRDEELDNLHSIYVDQWDWEKIISKEERNMDTLKTTVKKIYKVFKKTEKYICDLYPKLESYLPEDIIFITTQELEDLYPDLTPEQRENEITKAKGAVFLMQIGHTLNSGKPHDHRAPDYDDWNLNGDILFWYPVLNQVIELSSMGIRVDETSLKEQILIAGCQDRLSMDYHRELLEGKLPYTIGGGIGQSRMCMFFLGKAHIGEVQASIWSDEIIEECQKANIFLL
ncbi:MAG: aspartate--ammonia ligase [Clostridiales bacterium]|nr:aspartate--ammonia ligase [Clostridiales bacterium]